MEHSLGYDRLIEQSVQELRLKTAAHDGAWRLGEADWNVDQDAGEILFDAGRGITAAAPVQIIGTYDTDDSEWLWAWDNPSVLPSLQQDAAKVRDFGRAHGIDDLVTRKLRCTEVEAWELTALACKLCDAQGAYRGPAGSTLVFMTFGAVSLTRSEATSEGPQDGEDARDETVAGKVAGLPQVDAPEVLRFVHDYFNEMYAIEEEFETSPDRDGPDGLRDAVNQMLVVYGRRWRRDDDYWKPCSAGWPSDYELARARDWKVYLLSPDTYRVAYAINEGFDMLCAYDVRRFPDGLRIVDYHI